VHSVVEDLDVAIVYGGCMMLVVDLRCTELPAQRAARTFDNADPAIVAAGEDQILIGREVQTVEVSPLPAWLQWTDGIAHRVQQLPQVNSPALATRLVQFDDLVRHHARELLSRPSGTAANAPRNLVGQLHPLRDQRVAVRLAHKIVVDGWVPILPRQCTIPGQFFEVGSAPSETADVAIKRRLRLIEWNRGSGCYCRLGAQHQQVSTRQETDMKDAELRQVPAVDDMAIHVEQHGEVASDRRDQRVSLEGLCRAVKR
jgi:hypothetical protein